jgi:acyl-coenzyme A thioesterase PaaI-like protein
MSAAIGFGLTASKPAARPQSACFVCGQDNPAGLKIAFEQREGGELEATWIPGSAWEGFRGIVHGGVVSTVLDGAMSKAVAVSGTEALTAELRIRFRLPVHSGSPYQIRGWVVRRSKRLIETEAAITTLDGTEHAHAWASFLSLSKARA